MKSSLLLLAGLIPGACSLAAQTPTNSLPLNERVMVVYDNADENSRKVAKYYMEKRNIPKENICKLDSYNDGLLEGNTFEPMIKKPIRACLEKLGKQKILYIVMSYATPYEFELGTRREAIDQMLADIWDEYAGPDAVGREVGNQPYFGNAQAQGNAYEPFVSFAKYREQPKAKTIYSVWRLDGATPEIAKGLVDKALYAEAHGLKGKAYFDIRGTIQTFIDTGYGAGEWEIYRASYFANKAGFDTTLDQNGTEFGTAPSLLKCDNAALYAGWYSLQHYNDAFSWVPGAIGFHLDSASATDPHKGDNWVGGALLKGITVTSGSVTEPYLEGLVHPDQIFLYLFQGANVGDAVVRGTRWLKWMILNLGDPLYTPFPGGIGPYKSASYHDSWFGITPSQIVGGDTATATFALSDVVTKPVPVSAKSSHPDLVTLPADATIQANSNGVRFPLATKIPPEPTSMVITVSAGEQTLTNTLTVFPLLVDLTVNQSTMKSGGSALGTITIFAASKGPGPSIKLSSNNPAIELPGEVTFLPGTTKASFAVTAKHVSAEVTATITATVDKNSKSIQLKVTP